LLARPPVAGACASSGPAARRLWPADWPSSGRLPHLPDHPATDGDAGGFAHPELVAAEGLDAYAVPVDSAQRGLADREASREAHPTASSADQSPARQQAPGSGPRSGLPSEPQSIVLWRLLRPCAQLSGSSAT